MRFCNLCGHIYYRHKSSVGYIYIYVHNLRVSAVAVARTPNSHNLRNIGHKPYQLTENVRTKNKRNFLFKKSHVTRVCACALGKSLICRFVICLVDVRIGGASAFKSHAVESEWRQIRRLTVNMLPSALRNIAMLQRLLLISDLCIGLSFRLKSYLQLIRIYL